VGLHWEYAKTIQYILSSPSTILLAGAVINLVKVGTVCRLKLAAKNKLFTFTCFDFKVFNRVLFENRPVKYKREQQIAFLGQINGHK
jgi:hypothetical protein